MILNVDHVVLIVDSMIRSSKYIEDQEATKERRKSYHVALLNASETAMLAKIEAS